ncbi:MAG: hypothetical protein PHI04_09030 [Clostridiaceae bacterium]|nr:hypothetical protein [Clostridiaceae bacterium]
MDKVKFHSINDLTCGYYLRKSEKLIEEYEAGKEVQGINDIIELYNIVKYFENKVYLTEWTSQDIEHYENVVRSFIGVIGKFFKSITNESFITFYNDVDNSYKDDFWELVEKFKVYENIMESRFQEFMNTSQVWLHELLKYKHITEYFGSIIRDYMLNNCLTAELLLDKYEIKHFREKEPLYLPKELSSIDKETIINNYIESENPNLNYLRLISNIQSSKDKLEISPKTLLKSKKKAEEVEKQFFHKDSGIIMETTVSFSRSQDEEVRIKMEGQAITATYSRRWIEDNMDYATLLNNFIYLFNFVDLQMRCVLVNRFNEMGVFERFVLTSSQNAYIKGITFDRINILSLLQLAGYYNELFSLGVRLEEVIEWFFKEYLSSEFSAYNFKVTMPSSNSTMLEKCTNIMPAMEAALKQFSLFVQEGEIDFELLNIRSEHLIYKNIPSLVEKKYVYGIGDEFKNATFLLFSDQSGLGYNEKAEKSYENFFELVCEEKFKLSDYPNYCVSQINWLIDIDYLSIDGEEYIVFNDKLLVMILRDLYFNEVISYWKYTEAGRIIIEELENRHLIEFESSLFSRPEQDYINYFLNKSQFNNGLDLRNKYSHTQLNGDEKENIHNQNYMIFLRLFILSIIKLNDDFCTSDQIRAEN